MEKNFQLVLVRHGQAFHNIPDYTLTDSDCTYQDNLKLMNTHLTEKGEMQATLVAARLKDIKFDVAISSDLKRTMKTAEAIMQKNCSIEKMKYWSVARERCMGDFEDIKDVEKALWTIEKSGIIDADHMNWTPPNGESKADFRNRIRKFLQHVQEEALKVPVSCPLILVVSHGAFMDELYKIISTSEYGKSLPSKGAHYQNTGICQYSFTSKDAGKNSFYLEKAECTVLSCANHLENHDEDYVSCKGGCHGSSGGDDTKE